VTVKENWEFRVYFLRRQSEQLRLKARELDKAADEMERAGHVAKQNLESVPIEPAMTTKPDMGTTAKPE
jgi:hypothetical protein